MTTSDESRSARQPTEDASSLLTEAQRRWAARAQDDADKLVNRLRRNERRLRNWRKNEKVEAWRLYDHDLPEIPLHVDRYRDALAVWARFKRQDETPAMTSGWLDAQLDALAAATEIDRSRIFTKVRRRAPGGRQAERFEHVEREAVETEVVEDGLRFQIQLSDYLDTGLFLDHRRARRFVREQAAGLRVLNLFAYTGAFTVHAAAGNAASTLSVDASRTWLNRLESNMELNGFAMGGQHQVLRTDIVSWFRSHKLERGCWDLIILDPPTYSRSRHRDDDMDIQRDHSTLVGHALSLLASGGRLLFSTNHQRFEPSENLAQWGLQEVTERTASPDFRGSPHRAWWKGPPLGR